MTTLGFLGLGAMGGGMARCLLADGHQVVGFDPSNAAMAAFVNAGGQAAISVREVADRAEIIFASLPTIEASRRVTLDEDGISGGETVRIYVETSTIGPSLAGELANALASKGIAFLDAPVSGGIQGANDGTLTTIIGGDEQTFRAVEPAYKSMASHIVYIGPTPGAGQLFKVVNNFIVMNGIAMACQAIAVGVRAGASEAQLVDVINHSTGKCFATTTFFPTLIQPRSSPMTLEMAMKDIRLFVDLAREQGLPSESGETVLRQWSEATADGVSAVQWYEQLLR